MLASAPTIRTAIPLVRLALGLTGSAAALALFVGRAADGRAAIGAEVDRAPSAQFVDIPSHFLRYRATLRPLRAVRTGERFAAVVEIRTASGMPVDDAHLRVRGTMPENGHSMRSRPAATATGLPGHYRIDDLQLDAPGWWNIALTIATAKGTDSLAFNILLPED